MKNVSLKFIDIMIGVVLGLGFEYWANLRLPWQFIAFIFTYIDIVDYWIDYSPSLKKFPPKKEIDLLIDLAITFSLFLFIYSTQFSIIHFLGAFALFKALDFIWLLRARVQYKPTQTDGNFVNAWLRFNSYEVIVALLLILTQSIMSDIATLVVFIAFRVLFRILASLSYKKVYFA